MFRVLSVERVRLLRVAREKAVPVSDLASGLKRDTRAESRMSICWSHSACCKRVTRRIRDTAGAESSSLVQPTTSCWLQFDGRLCNPALRAELATLAP